MAKYEPTEYEKQLYIAIANVDTRRLDVLGIPVSEVSPNGLAWMRRMIAEDYKKRGDIQPINIKGWGTLLASLSRMMRLNWERKDEG